MRNRRFAAQGGVPVMCNVYDLSWAQEDKDGKKKKAYIYLYIYI